MAFQKLINLGARRVSAGYSTDELARLSTMAFYALQSEEDSEHTQASTGLFSDRDAAQIANVLGTTASDLRGE